MSITPSAILVPRLNSFDDFYSTFCYAIQTIDPSTRMVTNQRTIRKIFKIIIKDGPKQAKIACRLLSRKQNDGLCVSTFQEVRDSWYLRPLHRSNPLLPFRITWALKQQVSSNAYALHAYVSPLVSYIPDSEKNSGSLKLLSRCVRVISDTQCIRYVGLITTLPVAESALNGIPLEKIQTIARNNTIVSEKQQLTTCISSYTNYSERGVAMRELRGYFFMKEGLSLFQLYLKKSPGKALACSIFKQLILQLERLHARGYCHMDLKLDNIIVYPPNTYRHFNGWKVRIIDGDHIAPWSLPPTKGVIHSFTPFYTAPEYLIELQLINKTPVQQPGEPISNNHRIRYFPTPQREMDIYSLGCALYEFLYGSYEIPHLNKSLADVGPAFIRSLQTPWDTKVSSIAEVHYLSDLAAWMCAYAPEARPTPRQIADALDSLSN